MEGYHFWSLSKRSAGVSSSHALPCLSSCGMKLLTWTLLATIFDRTRHVFTSLVDNYRYSTAVSQFHRSPALQSMFFKEVVKGMDTCHHHIQACGEHP